ncbi:molybdenum cofactor guanylyltransferase [Saccharopolyspora rhizosphaerae]|uniref:Molybdenum cofactor guanylyltransferase n=1 Tax=Saccharopolyspora rhizosphaerae TaxID=2492662 RepID=A0A3R8P5C5_9PSEU|nr:molybdenum cofactor guanylyltransferase [Saccharopolyspora rhizosphaerae]RRO20481.1 molybdenum cofactor guanylyltransferase [Saccharopolyspora rhizosphaerae]
MADFAAVVLAGGRARRLGGVDKVMLPVQGRTLLDRTLDAVPDADPVVVVGPQRPTTSAVRWTTEDPAGGGPLAAVEAGLRLVEGDDGVVAVLAADHPHLTAGTLDRLREVLSSDPRARGAVLAEPGDRAQWLVGVWRLAALRRAMPEAVENRPVRDLFAPLEPHHVPATTAEVSDVDTPADLSRARTRSP